LINQSCFNKAQIPLRRLLPKLPRRKSRRHKSWNSQTKTIATCRDVFDKIRDKSRTNPFVSL